MKPTQHLLDLWDMQTFLKKLPICSNLVGIAGFPASL